MEIFFTNTKSRKKEKFHPINPRGVKMYVCGPTVYNRAHIGNGRSAVVFDLVYRLLKEFYNVTYVRNITDVDDKIIEAAKIAKVKAADIAAKYTKYFQQDLEELNCLKPDFEPNATDNIEYMISMIKNLINQGKAYVSAGHVYFDISTYSEYGIFANRKLNELFAGERVEISSLKRCPLDFVLWKPKKESEEVFFDSPWGLGRPGWHIECSAMSKRFLGDEFDIHGGGEDLIFPHHENEIAQSVNECDSNKFAKYWLHNSFLNFHGSKMSKSVGNIKTIRDVLNQGFTGAAIRYFYMTAHYRKQLDFNEKSITDAQKAVNKIFILLRKHNNRKSHIIRDELFSYMADDLNTPKVVAFLNVLRAKGESGDLNAIDDLSKACDFLGLREGKEYLEFDIPQNIKDLAYKRYIARSKGDWRGADELRKEVRNLGYDILDNKNKYIIRKYKFTN